MSLMLKKLFVLVLIGLALQTISWAAEKELIFTPVPDLPYFETSSLMIDANDFDTVVLKLKSQDSGTARFFWATSYNQQFNAPKSIWFNLKSGQHTYYFNVPSQNPNWLGWITKLLLYPETNERTITIEEANLTRGNLLTNIKSGWQEFWGPRGRKVIGSTINVIFSSNIFGHSINVYIYWLLFLYFLYLVAGQLRKGSFSWDGTGKKLVLATLFFWILLEISSSYNQWNIFRADWNIYAGKSVQEKAAASIGVDLYNFLSFCQQTVPPNTMTGVLLLPATQAHIWMKAKYYLFPVQIKDLSNTNIEPDFVLVYQNEPNQYSNNKRYKPWANFKDNEYILKKQ
ncbi:hypothetical protein A2291_07290 [candidate division WOR-1 bacterium RIFOXYB2_FULL_42_35]|uniref:Uncharacterized protein n=1 Tax=candidate division WOR-1 bacterium RIFOXYC2_FULL_41_25 TaxID=1802586 RepID=A0A1F4TKJ4_UNCSA|nr:MAG: hypothetical protein A2291_07290 [candidate division WOR-1 bacterium RIFOXYB2_FULL_42_35]OGC25592.1 MAG: hypothetical protein A2247_01600 [candidate division WOR-1 bacterium RIFOXYA2_FULL_41_14]OGC33248.1 MAG: hypothetical protein A2462_07465 [candidate division WOR-1 bacterium RIFOXYC2_FULL_41_25]